MLVALKEVEQLDHTWVVDSAHNLNFFENVGTLIVSYVRRVFSGPSRRNTTRTSVTRGRFLKLGLR